MRRPLVILHADSYDGFAAYWTCRRPLGTVEALPDDHGQEPPDPVLVVGRDVCVLDFCFTQAVLERIAQACRPGRLTVLDHHKTAQAELALPVGTGLFVFRFDPTKPGGCLAWHYFHPGNLVPAAGGMAVRWPPSPKHLSVLLTPPPEKATLMNT
jgi:hypothetical protein